MSQDSKIGFRPMLLYLLGFSLVVWGAYEINFPTGLIVSGIVLLIHGFGEVYQQVARGDS